MRIVFMGTPEFSVPALEQLIQSEHQVVAIYTQPDSPLGRGRASAPSPVKRAALKYGLEVHQPVRLRDPGEVERLVALKPNMIVVSAFGQLLPQSFLNIPPLGCLNIHPSLLPKYRGASPIAAAILAGDDKTGATIILMDAGLDTGPIVSQIMVDIEPQDTAESLSKKLARASARLLAETIPLWAEQLLTPHPQDERSASYTKPLTKENGIIDWHLGATEIWRRVRAFYPWPGCYSWWKGKLLKLLEAIPLSNKKEDLIPGLVIALPSDHPAVVGVETGEGILGLLRVQLEGKKALPAAEFLRGQSDFVGSILDGETRI